MSMATQKKIAAILLTVVGVIAVACNLIGIIGVWVAAGAVNSVSASLLSTVEQASQRSSELLGELDGSFAQLQTSVNNIESRVTQLGTTISENPVVLNALKREYDENATPQMRQIVQRLRIARTALDKAAATAEAFNSNPLTARVTPDFERLQMLDAVVDEVEAALIQLGLELRELKVDVTQAVTGGITTLLAKVESALQLAHDALGALDQQATNLEAGATALRNSLPFWINLTAFGITLIMLAAIIGGVALAWTSVSYLRSGGNSVDTLLGHFGANPGQ